MFVARRFRDIMIAELSLERGLAESRDVAAALQRFWDKRTEDHISLSQEIARIAGLLPETLAPIEREVDRLISEADGDARSALIQSTRGLTTGERNKFGTMLPPVGGGHRTPLDVSLRRVSEERYREFLLAGEGGMGIVYLAIDSEMNRQVAFKVVRPEAPDAGLQATPDRPLELRPPLRDTPASHAFEELKTRFLLEAWVTGGMEHPGIVPVYEVGQTPAGVPYYTMRFVRGNRTLASALAELTASAVEDRLGLLDSFLRVCDTIGYAHSKGVLHRDLKPENIALGEFGEVVVLDWGLARVEGRKDVAASEWQDRVRVLRSAGMLQLTEGALGTPGYMSPESAMAKVDEVDERSDVYSLGAILFEILTGRSPYEFSTYLEYLAKIQTEDPIEAVSLEPAAPAALSDLCLYALQRDTEQRPTSVDEFASAIRQWRKQAVVAQQVEGLLRDARTGLEVAADLAGNDLLRQLERVAGNCDQVLKIQPQSLAAQRYLSRVEKLRQRGLSAREAAARRRTLWRVGVTVGAAGLVTAVLFAAALKRKELQARSAEHSAESAQVEAESARDEASSALAASQDAERLARVAAQEARLAEAESRRLATAQRALTEEVDQGRMRAVAAEEVARTRAEDAEAALQRALSAEAKSRGLAERLHGSLRKAAALALTREVAEQQLLDPELALLLALEAMKQNPGPNTITALRSSLTLPYVSKIEDVPNPRHPIPYHPLYGSRGHPLLTPSSDGAGVIAAYYSGPAVEVWRSAPESGGEFYLSRMISGAGYKGGRGSTGEPRPFPYVGPSGLFFLLPQGRSSIVVYDRMGDPQQTLPCDVEAVRCCATSGTGRLAAIVETAKKGAEKGAKQSYEVRVWPPDAETSPRVAQRLSGGTPIEMAWSPAGTRVAVLFKSGTVAVADIEPGGIAKLIRKDAEDVKVTVQPIPGPCIRFVTDDILSVTFKNDWVHELVDVSGRSIAVLPGKTIGRRRGDGALVLAHINDGFFLATPSTGEVLFHTPHPTGHVHNVMYYPWADRVVSATCPSGKMFELDLAQRTYRYLARDATKGAIPIMMGHPDSSFVLGSDKRQRIVHSAGEALAIRAKTVFDLGGGRLLFQGSAPLDLVACGPDGLMPLDKENFKRHPADTEVLGPIGDSHFLLRSKRGKAVYLHRWDGKHDETWEVKDGEDQLRLLDSCLVLIDHKAQTLRVLRSDGTSSVFQGTMVRTLGKDRDRGVFVQDAAKGVHAIDGVGRWLDLGDLLDWNRSLWRFASDGRALLAFEDKGVPLILRAEHAPLRLPHTLRGRPLDVLVSAEGVVLVTADYEKEQLRVLRGQTGQNVTIPLHGRRGVHVAPDGGMVLTYDSLPRGPIGHRESNAVFIYGVDGTEACALRVPSIDITWARFMKDGEHIATRSEDGLIRLWHADWRKAMPVARARTHRVLTKEERKRYEDLLSVPERAGER